MPTAKKLRRHEWAWNSIGSRTVCGLQTASFVAGKLADVTVHDLGDVDVAERCKNCERLRAAIGASRKPEATAG